MATDAAVVAIWSVMKIYRKNLQSQYFFLTLKYFRRLGSYSRSSTRRRLRRRRGSRGRSCSLWSFSENTGLFFLLLLSSYTTCVDVSPTPSACTTSQSSSSCQRRAAGCGGMQAELLLLLLWEKRSLSLNTGEKRRRYSILTKVSYTTRTHGRLACYVLLKYFCCWVLGSDGFGRVGAA